MATNVSNQLLLGKLGVELPPLRSRVVRIFTSSTFTDTSVERNALMKDIYPKLKDYCKSKYGLEFQVVDMRWGVRDEATDDHMTSELCMNEIAACQKLSTGPNFVTFLCQKYGYRPFPPKIPAQEFEAMRAVLSDEGKSVETLDEWFQRDDNSVPPMYILQPISSKLTHFNDNANPDKMSSDRNKWWGVFETIQQQLRDASTVCKKKGKFNDKQASKYQISVTQDEVEHGILSAGGDRQDRCVCFVRKFADMQQQATEKDAKNFIDVDWETNKVDEDAQALLNDLRDSKVPGCLKPPNLIVSTLDKWSKEGIDVNIPQHKQYLDNFLKTFESTIISMIDRAVEKDKNHVSNHPMYEEILQHLTFCKVKCQSFHGRENLLSKIRTYVGERLKGNPATASPLVIHGESGSGKTSVMAKAAFQSASEWFGRNNAAVVLRFLGTTPASTGIRQLLRSVCQQVLTIYGYGNQQLPDDYFKVIRWFTQMFRYATKDRPLIIFLDSLDQLSASEGAHRVAWLPRFLPPYAALVVSTLPKEHKILETMQSMLSPQTTGYVAVTQLSVDDSVKIMDSWLHSEKRTTNAEQKAIISNSIKQCSLPLFLKLLFDQASRWQSYMPASTIKIEPSVKGMISLIFDRLEDYHGKTLVSRALAYMTISQNGIAEAELEDLLSLDDEVLQDVYAYWLPPTRRIPPLLWTRIRAEINDYLVEREAEGSRVIYWYHRQFIEASRERYLQDPQTVRKLHQLCAEYFIGVWSGGKKKPFTFTKEQVKKFGKGEKGEEDRKVAPQPLVFGSGDSRYNIRKLEQLPFHLIHADNIDHLKQHVLCNFQFLLTKLRGMNLAEVLQDFTMAQTKYEEDEELRLVGDTIRVGASALRENPDNLVVEVIGRLKDSSLPNIKQLVKDADSASSTVSGVPLIPYNQCFPAPGGLLRTQLMGHSEAILSLATTSDGRFVVSGSRDLTAIIWELESSTLLHTLKGKHQSPISSIAITPDNLLAITYCYKAEEDDDQSDEIHVWNIETGEHFLQLQGHAGHGKVPIRFTPDSKFAVCEMYSERVERTLYVREFFFKVWSLENGREICSVQAHQDFITDIVIARAQDGRPLIVTSGYNEDPCIKIWDLYTGKMLTEVRDRRSLNQNACSKMAVTANGRYVAMNLKQRGILDVYTGEFEDLDEEDAGDADYVKFSDDEKEVLYKDTGTIESVTVYNIEETKICRSMWFSESVSGGREDTFVTDDYQIIVSMGEQSLWAGVWKPPKVKIAGGNDSCILLRKLPHDQHINALSVVRVEPSILAITASEDRTIKVWNVDSVRSKSKSEKSDNKVSKSADSDDDDDDDDDDKDDDDDDDDEKENYAQRYPYLRRIVHRWEILDQEKRVALIDNKGKKISLYDVEKAKDIAIQEWPCNHGHALGGLASTPDGQRLYALGGYDLAEYNINTLEPVVNKKQKELDAFCSGLLIANDATTSLLLGGDRYVDDIYFYDINKKWYLKEYDPPSRVNGLFFLSGDRLLMPCSTTS
ncbi:NACHT and WD repeat domain-containing protein 2-like [Ptychodera flava]|uniref:NACHT and WD repeat domain-containing protein 2-like n=1 Tax=Ptychodera flava TaxID=63121 RepID=UPI00396A8B08